MATSLHRNLEFDVLHAAKSLEFADAAARTSFAGVAPTDIGRIAQQVDDNSWWLLAAAPSTWLQLGAGGAAPVFGADYQRVENLPFAGTTSTAFITRLALTTPALTGTYRVWWQAKVSQTSAADKVEAQLVNVTDAAVLDFQRHEPKDVTNRIFVGGAWSVAFTGAAKTFEIQWRQQDGSQAGIEGAAIEIWRTA